MKKNSWELGKNFSSNEQKRENRKIKWKLKINKIKKEKKNNWVPQKMDKNKPTLGLIIMKFQNTGDKDSSKLVWDGGGGFIMGSKILQTGKLQTRRPWNNKIKLFAN